MSQTIGTCGRCGGPVSYPDSTMKVGRVSARCERCGATPVANHGPVLPMNPVGKPASHGDAVAFFRDAGSRLGSKIGEMIGRPAQARDEFDTHSLPKFNAMDGGRSFVR